MSAVVGYLKDCQSFKSHTTAQVTADKERKSEALSISPRKARQMDIKIGDTVSFTLVGGSSKVLSMRTKSGNVEAINGQVATVRTSKAKTYDVHFSRLNNPREKTELTRFVEEVFRANRNQQ